MRWCLKPETEISYLKAVNRFLPIPDGLRERKLFPYSILPHSSQGPAPLPFGLDVVGSQPELLQEPVAARREAKALKQSVELWETPVVEGHGSLGLQDTLQLLKAWRGGGGGRGRKSAEEASQPIDAPRLQKDLANTNDLFWCEDHRSGIKVWCCLKPLQSIIDAQQLSEPVCILNITHYHSLTQVTWDHQG